MFDNYYRTHLSAKRLRMLNAKRLRMREASRLDTLGKEIEELLNNACKAQAEDVQRIQVEEV